MKTLLTIRDQDVCPGIDYANKDKSVIRNASRAVLFDKNNKIALLRVSKWAYYKLPGGGIDEGESKEEALNRECLEETGCKIKIIEEIGQIIEHRGKWNILQTSYCYVAKVLGDKGFPNFEQGELDDGFELIWVGIDEALNLVKSSKPDDGTYDGKFIVRRDATILLEAKKLIKEK